MSFRLISWQGMIASPLPNMMMMFAFRRAYAAGSYWSEISARVLSIVSLFLSITERISSRAETCSTGVAKPGSSGCRSAIRTLLRKSKKPL